MFFARRSQLQRFLIACRVIVESAVTGVDPVVACALIARPLGSFAGLLHAS